MDSLSFIDDDVNDDDYNLFLLLSAQHRHQKRIILDLVCQPCVEDNQEHLLNDVISARSLYCRPCKDETNAMYESEQSIVSVLALVKPIVDAFDASFHPSVTDIAEPFNEVKSEEMFSSSSYMKKNPRFCIGHKERVLGSSFSECGAYLATASQDSTIKIWNVETNQFLSTITLNKDYEALRVVWANSIWYEKFRLTSEKSMEIENPMDTKDSNIFILAIGGADGVVRLFSTENPAEQNGWTCIVTIDHSLCRHFMTRLAADPSDRPQIYSLQFIDPPFHSDDLSKDLSAGSFLLTSSDDHIHVWKISIQNKKLKLSDDSSSSHQFDFDELFSVRFSLDSNNDNKTCSADVCRVTDAKMSSSTSVEQLTVVGQKMNIEEREVSEDETQQIFGGARNPMNLVYVFDAAYCPGNGLIGIALSDGTFRILDDYGNLLLSLNSPDNASHLTSFSWHSSGDKIAACTASGLLIVWTITINDDLEQFQPSVTVTLCVICSDGSDNRAPLYGAAFLNLMHTGNDLDRGIIADRYPMAATLIVAWSSDGKLYLWDANNYVLVSELRSDFDYPIYSVSIDVHEKKEEGNKLTFAVAGGGVASGFIGIPVYLFHVFLKDID